MLKQKVLEWHPVWAGYVFWQSWHGTPDCSQSSASTSVSKGCSCTVQCSAGSSLLCPHSCSHSMSMLAFLLVGGVGSLPQSRIRQSCPSLWIGTDAGKVTGNQQESWTASAFSLPCFSTCMLFTSAVPVSHIAPASPTGLQSSQWGLTQQQTLQLWSVVSTSHSPGRALSLCNPLFCVPSQECLSLPDLFPSLPV